MLKLIAGDPMDSLLVDPTKVEINEMPSKKFILLSKMVLKKAEAVFDTSRGE
jgi:hypothetical protein